MRLRAAATDDVGVAAVTYTVNGVDAGTTTMPPYELEYTAPAGMLALNVGATAVDAAGNSAAAPTVAVSVLAPQVVGSITLPGAAARIAVNGNYAYVCSIDGLQIIDISVPAAPSLVRTVPLGMTLDIRLFGRLAYAGTNMAMVVLDIADPANPAVLSSTPMVAQSLDLVGTAAYIASGTTMRRYDLSDPRTPAGVGANDQNTHLIFTRALGRFALFAHYASYISTGRLLALSSAATMNYLTWYDDMVGNQVLNNTFNDISTTGNAFVMATSTGLTAARFNSKPAGPRRIDDPFGFAAVAWQDAWLIGVHDRNVESNQYDTAGVLFDSTSHWALRPRATISTGIAASQMIAADITPTHVFMLSRRQDNASSTVTIAKYRDVSDTFGAAPSISISASGPASRDRLLRITAAATDDVGVAAVTFTLNGVDVATDSNAPFDVTIIVPPGAASPAVIGARATDFGGNVRNAATVSLPLQ
jgi:hypothetical protein